MTIVWIGNVPALAGRDETFSTFDGATVIDEASHRPGPGRDAFETACPGVEQIFWWNS